VSDANDEWNHREVCPDGSCVGLIGPEGTCKVCGRAAPNWGDERKRGMIEPEEEEDDDDDDDEDDDAADEGDDGGDEDDDEDDEDDEDDDEEEDEEDEAAVPAEVAEPAKGGGAWANRKLCSDGACVGVIGANGKCKVCGRSAA
jgi:hypothetical protein